MRDYILTGGSSVNTFRSCLADRRTTSTAVATVMLLVLAGCERLDLDRQMASLCNMDGGVKVYETAKVPADWLDFAGHPKVLLFPRQSSGAGLSRQIVQQQYVIEEKHSIIKGRNNDDAGLYLEGKLHKSTTTVRRISDNKVLGEEISYGRSGGDISLGHPSSSSCPNPRPSPDVVQAVFKVEER